MKRVLAFVAVLLTVGLVTTVALAACGDKFLVVSRGTRFQVPAVRRPAAILVFTHPSSLPLSGALTHESLSVILEKAGYRPTVVADDAAFGDALLRGGWDLVVTDVEGARAVAARFGNVDQPAVLPIVYKPTTAELVRVRAEFRRVVKAPTSGQSFLSALDGALATRSKTGN